MSFFQQEAMDKKPAYIQVVPKEYDVGNMPEEMFAEALECGHHHLAVRGTMDAMTKRFKATHCKGDSYFINVTSGTGHSIDFIVEPIFSVEVSEQSYVCFNCRESQLLLSKEAFARAIAEARHLKKEVVFWHPQGHEYDFSMFHDVLKKQMQDKVAHGSFVSKVCEGEVEMSPKFDSFGILFRNGSLIPNRACKSAMGTVEAVLFSPNEGLNLHPKFTVLSTKITNTCIRREYQVSGAKSQGNIFYCGHWIGDSLTGSDGFCGPDNGPACPACCSKRQKHVSECWKVNLNINSWTEKTMVVISMTPVVDPSEESADSSQADTCSGGAGSSAQKRPRETDNDCCVCMEKEKTHAAVPCGHKCVCEACSKALGRGSKCPICRKEASSWMHVFG